jgi:hypothetical protein
MPPIQIPIQYWDDSIYLGTDFTLKYATSEKKNEETPAQFRARTAQELFDSGKKWEAYTVLYNTLMVAHAYWPLCLKGYLGTVEETAEIIEGRFQWMRSVRAKREQRILDEDESLENIVKLVKRVRRVFTFGFWK